MIRLYYVSIRKKSHYGHNQVGYEGLFADRGEALHAANKIQDLEGANTYATVEEITLEPYGVLRKFAIEEAIMSKK